MTLFLLGIIAGVICALLGLLITPTNQMKTAIKFVIANVAQGLGVGIGLLIALPVAEIIRGLLT